jgi:UDP-2-acetamido-3-amino-2,3-dideoxy-glucuronate N-acetyltransferase
MISVHPTAIVDAGAMVGDGSRVWHWVHVCGGARIARDCSLGQNVFVGNKVVIGNNVKIQNNVSIYHNVTLGDDVFCGRSAVFTNVYNPRSAVARKAEYRDTFARRGATLGANCTIVCGVTIGEYAFVAAGAVLNRDVRAFALVGGGPARQIGWMSRQGGATQASAQRNRRGHLSCYRRGIPPKGRTLFPRAAHRLRARFAPLSPRDKHLERQR